MVLQPLETFNSFRVDRLYMSEYDVYKRQILTYKVGSCAEKFEMKKVKAIK